jgi:hypothetical protein
VRACEVARALLATVPAGELCAEPRLLPKDCNVYAHRLRHIGVGELQTPHYVAQLRASTWLQAAAAEPRAPFFFSLLTFLSCTLTSGEEAQFTNTPRQIPVLALADVRLLPCDKQLIAPSAATSVFFPGTSVVETLKSMPPELAAVVRVHVLDIAIMKCLPESALVWLGQLGVRMFSDGAYCARVMHALRKDAARNAPLLLQLATVVASRWANFVPEARTEIKSNFPLQVEELDGSMSFVSHATFGNFASSVVLPPSFASWSHLFTRELRAVLRTGHLRALSEVYTTAAACPTVDAGHEMKRWLLDLNVSAFPKLPTVTLSQANGDGRTFTALIRLNTPQHSRMATIFTSCLAADALLAACTTFSVDDILAFPCLQQARSGNDAVRMASCVLQYLQAALDGSRHSAGDLVIR